jgi:hypothetical protein
MKHTSTCIPSVVRERVDVSDGPARAHFRATGPRRVGAITLGLVTDTEHEVRFDTVMARVRDAVQTVAATDPNPNDPYRGLYVGDDLALTLGTSAPVLELEQRFDLICARLALDPLDRAVLALCAAPEVHADYGRLFGYLHDDLARRAPSPRLVARLLSGPGASDADVLVCFDRAAPLIMTGAVRLEGSGPLADRAARVGSLLAAFLLGSNLADAASGRRLRRLERSPLPLGRGETVQRLASALDLASGLPLLVTGPDARLLLAEAAGCGLVILDAHAASDEEACADLALASALEERVAVIDGLEDLPREDRRAALERICALPCDPAFCSASRDEALALADRPLAIIESPEPTVAERRAAWQAAAGREDVGAVASRFRLEISRIGEAVAAARTEATMDGREQLDADLLARGARLSSSRRVGEVAELLAAGPTWEEIVLPERQLSALHLLSAFLTKRERVLDEWGFASIAGDRGLTALFAGESGTGKTMAASVIAAAAGLDLYRVDLAGLFSKWVGETEKNLDRIFRAAHGANAVLLFDEADVVFGKRTETSDASDRYANLETAYLLQRIERYDGVVILTTNLRSNLDEAFLRRLDVVVDFPPPEASTRRRLWEVLLSHGAPMADNIDLDFLAERFELTGGGIRNCALAAAFLAAEKDAAIDQGLLVRAVAIEYAKLGRLTMPADFEHLGNALP